jgi:hypothetical protein
MEAVENTMRGEGLKLVPYKQSKFGMKTMWWLSPPPQKKYYYYYYYY